MDKTDLIIWILILGIIGCIIQFIIDIYPFIFIAVIIFLVMIILYIIYENIFYRSKKFINMKNKVQVHIENCNELNQHLIELKNIHIGFSQLYYGKAEYQDKSVYNYSRPAIDKITYKDNVYNCSRTVLSNARNQPLKYLCKYFNIKFTEENLDIFENLLNNLESAVEGINVLKKEKEKILNGLSNKIPLLITMFGMKRFEKELGIDIVDFEKIEYPKYTFNYVSPAGKSHDCEDVTLDIEQLNRLIYYLSENIKFRKSVAGQRALMTSRLRKEILARDNYTCQKCGNSTRKEPNLLLEIDHIIPLSKGGLTKEDNLQTLCWRCNRSKGSKIEQ